MEIRFGLKSRLGLGSMYIRVYVPIFAQLCLFCQAMQTIRLSIDPNLIIFLLLLLPLNCSLAQIGYFSLILHNQHEIHFWYCIWWMLLDLEQIFFVIIYNQEYLQNISKNNLDQWIDKTCADAKHKYLFVFWSTILSKDRLSKTSKRFSYVTVPRNRL